MQNSTSTTAKVDCQYFQIEPEINPLDDVNQ